MDFLSSLKQAKEKGEITEKIFLIFMDLFLSYKGSLPEEILKEGYHEKVFKTFLEKVKEELVSKHTFHNFHRHVRQPFDYYSLGLDFVRPLIKTKSSVENLHILDKVREQLARKENVVFLANHQTEVDPQIISALLEKTHPDIGLEMIFVAGDRVVTDPMAIPFSYGRNLLCIYSKRHIANPPEKKSEKLLHNQRTMRIMKDLFREGGWSIYVAPSGGRDRINPEGIVKVAAFDPNNIEMFRLIASGVENPTHFYPLSLVTYNILPPPREIESEIGEMRVAKRDDVFLSFGEELHLDTLHPEIQDRHARRLAVAEHVWHIVSEKYQQLLQRKTSS